jgi:hypothetical protein
MYRYVCFSGSLIVHSCVKVQICFFFDKTLQLSCNSTRSRRGMLLLMLYFIIKKWIVFLINLKISCLSSYEVFNWNRISFFQEKWSNNRCVSDRVISHRVNDSIKAEEKTEVPLLIISYGLINIWFQVSYSNDDIHVSSNQNICL